MLRIDKTENHYSLTKLGNKKLTNKVFAEREGFGRVPIERLGSIHIPSLGPDPLPSTPQTLERKKERQENTHFRMQKKYKS